MKKRVNRLTQLPVSKATKEKIAEKMKEAEEQGCRPQFWRMYLDGCSSKEIMEAEGLSYRQYLFMFKKYATRFRSRQDREVVRARIAKTGARTAEARARMAEARARTAKAGGPERS